MWSAWFMRFAAERGLYAIYTNFPNEQSFIVNYRDKVRVTVARCMRVLGRANRCDMACVPV